MITDLHNLFGRWLSAAPGKPAPAKVSAREPSLIELVKCHVEAKPLSPEQRFQLLTEVGRALMPSYRFEWPQLQWWDDPAFNDFLARFGELNGLNTGRRWTLHQLLRLVEAVPGDTAECGVYIGTSSYLICQANRRSAVHRRWHYLFDSFEGLSQPGEFDGDYWARGNLACREETARENLADFTNLSFHRGWIPERFPEIESRRFAFVHIDVDLYEPTRDSLAFFYPRLNPGGIILCDDYGFTTCPGATQACEEYLRDKPEKMIALAGGGGFLIKQCLTAGPSAE